MADLVFRARIDLLRRNLRVVEGVLAVIEERFRRSPTVPPEISDTLATLLGQLQSVVVSVEGVASEETIEIFNEARKTVRGIKNQLFPPGALTADRVMILPNDHDLKNDLVLEAQASIGLLDVLEAKIGTIPTSEVWADFHTIELACQKLFYEYVDLVRGVALRSSGYDRELCLIADELVRSVSKKWRSITIPSRLERMGSTSGRIIRIGFPEWTVWNVPLAIHEYGHVFVDVVPELRELLDEEENHVEQLRLETLMADAFAALTIGPAYGCAAVLTRLDAGAPARVAGGSDHVVQRAAMIIAALEQGTQPDEARAMTTRLRDEWVAAVADAGYAGDALGAHPRADELLEQVEKQCFGLRLPYDRWADFVMLTADKLLSSATSDDEPAPVERLADVDLRHLFNAAWLCRVPPSQQAQRVATDADALGRIAGRVGAIALGWLGQPPVATDGGRGQTIQQPESK